MRRFCKFLLWVAWKMSRFADKRIRRYAEKSVVRYIHLLDQSYPLNIINYAGYELNGDTFFIKITPEAIHRNVIFAEQMAEYIMEFEKDHPNYQLCFVGEKHLMRLDNLTAVLYPNDHAEVLLKKNC